MKKSNISYFWYRFFRMILSVLYKIYYNPKIYGKENIPKTGGTIIAGNHKHIMDQCNVIISTDRVIHYMAKKEYFDGLFSWFFKITCCISVNRKIKDEKAKAEACKVLDSGGVLGIFPEGTRNRTFKKLLPFKYGAVSLAKKCNSLIVPVGITGDYKFRSKNLKIYIGKPFNVADMELEAANEKLYREISKLIEKDA